VTAVLKDLWSTLLSCRQLDDVHPQLHARLGLQPHHTSAGLLTCDQDDALYIALDMATKEANVDVVFGKSFYAGSKHASGPLSGEVLGIVAADNPSDVAEALWVIREALQHTVRFQSHADNGPAFMAHVVSESGSYLSSLAGMPLGAPLAYLIAPPAEAMLALDAALKAARVEIAHFVAPPSETNFGGALLSGALADVIAARDAFVDCIADVAARPLIAARRPDRLRR
jgi:ethanolamine utilization protein EutL